MNIVIRADASFAIGTGHVMRCLTLADALRRRGATIAFICREHPGNLISLIEGKGYPVARLFPPTIACDAAVHSSLLGVSPEQDAAETIAAVKNTRPEWLITDHYVLDRTWEEALRPHVGQIMVIDDLADRHHVCDVLLDQNFYPDMDTRYTGLVPDHCRKFFGPDFVLLREEFYLARRTVQKRDGDIRRILVFFGGSDPTNETEKALNALQTLNRRDIAVDVVVGSSNPNRDRIQGMCRDMPYVTFHCQVTNMAELTARADLALGAGGSTMWERCFLKLPAIVWITADNQRETTEAAAHFGAVRSLGHYAHVTAATIVEALSVVITNHEAATSMAERCSELIGESRGVDEIMDHLTGKKELKQEDR